MFTLIFTPKAEAELERLKDHYPQKYKLTAKTLGYLQLNPRYPGLQSHKFYNYPGYESKDIFEAYVENNTPAAYRIFWHYGPGKNVITILAIIQHP